ncbi:hypothetical protein N658DRAFT_482729 [Parathielavia hyrcaniae]|uniref:Uncharacterized protein n=1 Tax=Parathielavia hyrcaniae TaxID=113614 RepID=A0AAN6Q7V5_9PEZI|nr:hypothetical protein N658DRAFT_482729 [Parathielavia hyrcaniae]
MMVVCLKPANVGGPGNTGKHQQRVTAAAIDRLLQYPESRDQQGVIRPQNVGDMQPWFAAWMASTGLAGCLAAEISASHRVRIIRGTLASGHFHQTTWLMIERFFAFGEPWRDGSCLRQSALRIRPSTQYTVQTASGDAPASVGWSISITNAARTWQDRTLAIKFEVDEHKPWNSDRSEESATAALTAKLVCPGHEVATRRG